MELSLNLIMSSKKINMKLVILMMKWLILFLLFAFMTIVMMSINKKIKIGVICLKDLTTKIKE